jgi:hypothetical protein
MSTDSSRPGEPADPIDAYDSQHGKMGSTIPTESEAEQWGTALNPVRENHTGTASNLK